MAPKQGHMLDRVAERVDAELERMSDRVAERLDQTLLDDQRELSEPAFLEQWRARWPDGRWRALMLERMGHDAFVAAANRAFGVPAPEPLGRLAREGAARTRQAQRMAGQAVAEVQAAVPPGPLEPGSGPGG